MAAMMMAVAAYHLRLTVERMDGLDMTAMLMMTVLEIVHLIDISYFYFDLALGPSQACKSGGILFVRL